MPTNFVTPLRDEYGVADARTAPAAAQGTDTRDQLVRDPGIVTARAKMKRTLAWICAALAALLVAAIEYRFGLTLFTILVGLLLLACPLVVISVSLRLSRQCERDVRDTVEREIRHKL